MIIKQVDSSKINMTLRMPKKSFLNFLTLVWNLELRNFSQNKFENIGYTAAGRKLG